MILPSTASAGLVYLAISLILLGSWANLQKLTKKWRYEFFYLDFAFGVALLAIVAAFTLGAMNSQELTFQDNLLIASYHKIAYTLGAGVLINLSMLFLVASISVAPMVVVFPLSTCVALVVGTIWMLFPVQGNVLLIGVGAVLLLIAVVVGALGYSSLAQEQRLVKTGGQPEPRGKVAKGNQASAAKGIALSIFSGIVASFVVPVLNLSRSGEDGIGMYSAGLLIGLAMFASTIIFTPFTLSFPVQGAPLQPRSYLKGTKGQHLLGVLAGAMWMGGLITSFASGGSMSKIEISPETAREFAAGASLLAAVWGLVAWREVRGGSFRVISLLAIMLVLGGVGATLLAMSAGLGR